MVNKQHSLDILVEVRMENKSFFEKFKYFYNERNGKIILFFGFYLIFFAVLGVFLRNVNNNPKENEEQKEVITTYDVSKIVNNDFTYQIKVLDNDEIVEFNGTKNNVDYENYANKYFFDIYNINQLIKKSKYVKTEENVLYYELSNEEINEVLLTEKNTGLNQIEVSVKDDTSVYQIVLDLAKYLEKDKYLITINYSIGEENENSIS